MEQFRKGWEQGGEEEASKKRNSVLAKRDSELDQRLKKAEVGGHRGS